MNSIPKNEIDILRALAHEYMELYDEPVQEERRALWRAHNSLKPTRPLIYIRAFAWQEMPHSKCICNNPLLRYVENQLRYKLFWHSFNDDSIFEPWLILNAVYSCSGWGIEGERQYSDEPGGSFKIDYPIKEYDDIVKLQKPRHEIDEAATAENYEIISQAIGDIIPIVIDRGPAWRMWSADLSTSLGVLRGIEHFMLDMMDNPEWLHQIMSFMSDGVLHAHTSAEEKGDWRLCAHQNQSMPYAEELQDPSPDDKSVMRKDLWYFMAAQEFTAVSPAMHDEFLLQYQLPILQHFGLVAYGCCEDLTHKIDMLRRIPNLRRIAVSPFADVDKCAEQIQQDYVFSYRPSPAEMVSYNFDKDRIKKYLKRDFEKCKNCHVDITLKDVETVENDPDRIRKWVEITREVIDDIW